MRVLLSGYYGHGNLGDEALLAGMVRGLQERGHEPVVLSADGIATSRLHGVPSRSRTVGLVPALLAADALISGGGGLLQDRTSGRSLAYYLGVVRLARLFGVTTIVYGQSVGPLSDRGRRWAHRALQGVPVAVRDRSSQELLAGLGIDSTRTADPALLLGEPVGPDPLGSDPVDLEHATIDRPNIPRRRVVIVPRAGYPEHTAALAEVARRVAKDGGEVVTMALHPSQDAAAAGEIQRSGPDGSPFVPGDYRDAIRCASHASVVVSTRLHALIFAAMAGVPHVGLVYDPKVSGFLEESGGASFASPLDVDALYRSVSHPEPMDATRRLHLLDQARSGMDWLDEQLRASS